MKTFYATIIAFACVLGAKAQPFDFYSSIYYLSPDESTAPGTELSSSTVSLLGFNYSSASANHAIFTTGIYYPVQDCSNQNLWVRIQHIAADPNGTSVGINIPQTYGNPCQSSIMIGGWAGFLYDFMIFQDMNLTGDRAYVLGALYPTSLTVASLEWMSGTCGSSEWISFAINNSGSTGWHLNSVNFSGSNPNSNPAYSDTLAVYTTGGCYPPDGFSYSFPTGADSISFINASTNGYTEFKMSAGGVSHFQYGYEFIGQSGGYQGMSMEFGAPPIITVDSHPACGDDTGSISLETIGTAPFTFDWGNGNTANSSAAGLAAGDYTIVVSDANGCSSTQSVTIEQFDAFDATINATVTDEIPVLEVILSGGTPEFSYEWSTGETTATIEPQETADYTVEVTDSNGCVANAFYAFVSVEELHKASLVSLWPNPVTDIATFQFNTPATELRITNSQGQVIEILRINNWQTSCTMDCSKLPSGTYYYTVANNNAILQSGKILVSR